MHPLFEKYLVAWRVWNDYNKHVLRCEIEERNGFLVGESTFYIEQKYSLTECIRFSIECSVIVTLLYSVTDYFSNELNIDWQPMGAKLGVYTSGHSPLTTEIFLLLLFSAMIATGKFIHFILVKISSSGVQDEFAVSRFLVLYPGLVISMYTSSVGIDAILNGFMWFFRTILAITLHDWLVGSLNILIFLSYLAVVYFIFFAPLIFVQLIRHNYASAVDLDWLKTLLTVIAVVFIIYILY